MDSFNNVEDGYQADKEGEGEERPESLCSEATSSTLTLTQDRADNHLPQIRQRPSISSQYDGISDQESRITAKPPSIPDVIVEDTADSNSSNDRLLKDKEDESTVDGEVMIRQRPELQSNRNLHIKKRARLSQILTNSQLSSSSTSSSSSSDEETIFAIRRTDKARFPALKQPASFLEIQDPSYSEGNSSDAEQQCISMQVLSKLVTPEILSDVKCHLKNVSQNKRDSLQLPPPSPALQWEIRQKNKRVLDKTQASQIKAGQRVRQCLRDLPDSSRQTVNSFYLKCVKLSLVREVKALFTLAKVDPTKSFDKNCKDSDQKSALIIAIENMDVPMMQLLVHSNVDIGYCIFHLIRNNCVDGLKILLEKKPCIDLKITEDNPYFQAGLTPMLLAAHDNKYKILSLLYDYGHRLNKSPGFSSALNEAWESANERRMICEARVQPAYITLMSEVYRKDPMKICLKEIKTLRKNRNLEHEFSDFYKSLIGKCEEYMCALLDEIRSSNELAQLFKYEYKQLEEPDYYFRDLLAMASRSKLCERLELLEKASKHHLLLFVTHQQSQLALAYLRYRSVPFMRTHSLPVRNFISITMGMLFPLWSLAYLINPRSDFGNLLTLPTFSFACHMMSDIMFAVLLLLNIAGKTIEGDELGSLPSTLEWLIFFWIVGKWVQEVQECLNRGPKAYFRDYWNYSDILLLLLFTVSIILRIFDIFSNMNPTENVPRSEWQQYEPRLIAEGLQACAYVFVFIRLLGIVRVDRNLGPLQISLGRMMTDVLRFLTIFGLIICAFGFGLSELYWYYATEEGSKMLCSHIKQTEGNSTTCDLKHKQLFGSIPNSITSLFWSLFGLLDIEKLSLSGKHGYTESVGRSLVAIYHIIAIIVMLNMLIAMMSKSYEDTSANEEIEWKFHRTSMWIRFIRREVVRPPPMNLVPNPWRFKESYFRFKNFCKVKCCTRSGDNKLTEDVYNASGKRIHRYKPKNVSKDAYSIEMEETMDSQGEILSTDDNEIATADTEVAFHQPHLVPSERDEDQCRDKGLTKSLALGSSTRIQRNPGWRKNFKPGTLQEVETVMKSDITQKEYKRVLAKLVCRYKLKNLI